jgi:carbamoylphosphate synthase small subunit
MDPHNLSQNLKMGVPLLLLPKVTDPSADAMLLPLTWNMVGNGAIRDEWIASFSVSNTAVLRKHLITEDLHVKASNVNSV